MEGKIAYRFETPAYPGNILYVNIIPKYSCINDCLFCSRPRDKEKENIYEKKAGTSLFLPRKPTIEEITHSIDSNIKEEDKEVAIIGLGEPLMFLPTVEKTIRYVKDKYKIKTRVDTNGLVKCMYENPAERLKDAGLDEIRISLNATNEEDYNRLCRPKFENAISNLLGFIKDCLTEEIDTYISFVVGFEDEDEKDYVDFAVRLGIKKENILLRKYVPPI
ncbi:radical SAM protein [Nanoarchaeota archaeon]